MRNFARGSAGAELVIAEGSMGLFDGVAGRGAAGDGASADIAARFGLPVVLVIDASGQSQSAGAVAMGFRDFNPKVKIAGVILGNVASERHRLLATRGVERAGLPVFGALPRGGVPAIPERHLGLMQAEEIPQCIAHGGCTGRCHGKTGGYRCDYCGGGLRSAVQHHRMSKTPPTAGIWLPPGKRIALASDVAFSFVYAHMLAGLAGGGREDPARFRRWRMKRPRPDADVCWLPGGYPELHAQRLAGNHHFMNGLRQFAAHKPVHGECGGYMVLGENMIDASGKNWKMAGLLPL